MQMLLLLVRSSREVARSYGICYEMKRELSHLHHFRENHDLHHFVKIMMSEDGDKDEDTDTDSTSFWDSLMFWLPFPFVRTLCIPTQLPL